MTETYRIGPFLLDADAGVLLRGAAPVALGKRAVAVLVVLVRSANEFVPKARIIDAAWPGLIVEEGNLAVQILAIRRALGQAPGSEGWLETLPKRGYRFVGPVARVAAPAAPGTEGASARSNLPASLTSFVGRQRELGEIAQLLATTRMLTLVGSGGIGKTRLALRTAADTVDHYRDGAWLVELATVSDARGVPQAVATALGLREHAGKRLATTLAEHLRARQLLLVLDNAEHLAAACARLADTLLRECPDLVILATSREALRVPGEQIYRVPPLSMPDASRAVSAGELAQYESARLFLERARLQVATFAVTDEAAPTLASICTRLDGIPLAIELAAARVRSMSLHEINERLDHRFRLLTGGWSTVLPRQQTLRALIDWSYDLLDPAEQALLCRLSVFSGGWTLDAAEQVCNGGAVADGSVLDLLTSLGDKSLVQTEERAGATRCRLLETVREYARDRLRESGDEASWKRRHLSFFLKLAELAEPALTGAQQQAWIGCLDTEHDNLRAAMAWAAAPGGDALAGLRLAGAIWRFWYNRGYLGEGRAWFSALLVAATPDHETAPARAKVLTGAGGLARRQGDYAAARAFHDEGLRIQRELGDRRGIATSLNALGIIAREQGDFSAAGAIYEEALALRREVGDRWGIAASLNNLGLVAQSRRDFGAAQALHTESIEIYRDLGDRQAVAAVSTNLGLVASRQGDFATARTRFEQSIADFIALGDRWGMAWSLEGLATVAWKLADPPRAARIWGAAQRIRGEIGCPLPPSERPDYDRDVAAARAAMGSAGFEAAWAEGRSMSLEQALAYALGRIAL